MDRKEVVQEMAKMLCRQTEGKWLHQDYDVRERLISQCQELLQVAEECGYVLKKGKNAAEFGEKIETILPG